MVEKAASTFDLVIFGAFGFTGKHVIREALKPESLQDLRRPHMDRRPTLLQSSSSSPTSLTLLPSLSSSTPASSSTVLGPSASTTILTSVGSKSLCSRWRRSTTRGQQRRELWWFPLVGSTCGFNSVPTELRLMFCSRQWEPSAAPNWVEAHVIVELERNMVRNIGIFEFAVLGAANAFSIGVIIDPKLTPDS